jgi:pimeloyl-ACP methyl ester carboxylesterase
MIRSRWLACAVAFTTLVASDFAFAQGKTASKGREIEEKTLTTNDDVSIAITYYKSAKGKESPAVILLHQERDSKLVWKSFAERLQDEGYAVIAVDLRKHGLNVSGGGNANVLPTDYGMMVNSDLEAVKTFLFEENEKQALNMRKTAVVAAGMSGPIAVNFAANDWLKTPHSDAPTLAARTPRGQDIRALLILSPDKNLPKMPAEKALIFLRDPNLNVAVFIGYGKTERGKGTGAKDYDKQLRNNEKVDRIILQDYETNEHGTGLLGKKLRVEEHMIGFLKKYLMDLNGPEDAWRSRKSRLASK